MSQRKLRRQAYYARLKALQTPETPRANPFLCSACGEAAVWRHYDPVTNDHVASFCASHAPVGEAKHGEVSGLPTENGEYDASKATVTIKTDDGDRQVAWDEIHTVSIPFDRPTMAEQAIDRAV